VANSSAYLPDLAGSLNNLSVRLAETGREREAEAVRAEANGGGRKRVPTSGIASALPESPDACSLAEFGVTPWLNFTRLGEPT
jgi:hypothetical protein